MKRLKGLRGKAGMRGYGNIPFIILILWMVVIFFVFRLTMNSIGMQMNSIRWERIGSNLSSWALDLVGLGKTETDSSQKIHSLVTGKGITENATARAPDPLVQNKKTELALDLDDGRKDRSKPAEPPVQKPAVHAPVRKPQEPAKKKTEQKPEAPVKPETRILQCGAFSNRSGAEKRQQQLISWGYQVSVKEAPSGKKAKTTWYRVLVGSFGSAEEQERAHDEILGKGISCYRITYGGK